MEVIKVLAKEDIGKAIICIRCKHCNSIIHHIWTWDLMGGIGKEDIDKIIIDITEQDEKPIYQVVTNKQLFDMVNK